MGTYSANDFRSYTELEHSGRLGQKWHVKHGPPYPLGKSQLTGAYKKNGGLSESAAKRDGEKPGAGSNSGNGRESRGTSSYRSAYEDHISVSRKERKGILKEIQDNEKHRKDYAKKAKAANDRYREDMNKANRAATDEEHDRLTREADERLEKNHPASSGYPRTSAVKLSENETIKRAASSIKNSYDDQWNKFVDYRNAEDKFYDDYAKKTGRTKDQVRDSIQFDMDMGNGSEDVMAYGDWYESSSTKKLYNDYVSSYNSYKTKAKNLGNQISGKYANKVVGDYKNATVSRVAEDAIEIALANIRVEEERQRNR